MRVEHEYMRGGALAYLPAWDVHRAKLFGRCESGYSLAPRLPLVIYEERRSATRIISAFWVLRKKLR